MDFDSGHRTDDDEDLVVDEDDQPEDQEML
jgi:hypothetical protein